MRTVILNASIFDGSGRAPFGGSVSVVADRIDEVVPGGAIETGPGDQVIDAAGRTLMPGMVDAHAHLSWGSSVEKIYHQFMLPPDELRVATWRNARVLLDHGFTSAYSAGALGETLEVDLRDEIAAGKTPGPRLIASTLERSPEGEEGVETGNIEHGRGPEAMRAFIAHCRNIGIDSVKLIVSGEDALKPNTAQDILYTDEEMQAAGEAAREAGLWIATHTYSSGAIRMAIAAGARILYHCSFADEAAMDAMEAKKGEIFYAPGPGVSVAALEATPPPHIDMTHMKASAKTRMELEARLVPELKRRGVRILIGGDYGFPFNPNGRNARDLEHFVQYFGYSPAEALNAATMLGGQLMGRGDELGLVRAGYLADLLLVDGDPTRDVGILQDKNRLAMIMQGGRMHKAPVAAGTATAAA
jgi:imidazolonepropionase-like amidohydrolase